MTLNGNTDIKECKDGNVTFTFPRNIHYLTLDSFIILTCLTSLLLCARSLINGILLQFEYTAFFRALRKSEAPWSDRMEFVNGWYILIILSDSLAISGSLLKIGIHLKNFTSYDVCSILLGIATLLVWTEVIWYLDLFQKYNVLTLALKAAFPNVLRFCGCVIMIFLGYCFCGWIVLGPYHSKFQTLNTVSECLFSVISGDVFHTFKNIRRSSYLVWLFSRLYLYSFVLLFVYMVFSLFISLITDTCNTVKQQQQDRRTESALRAFIDCKDLPDSGKFTLDKEPDSCSFCNCLRCVT